jgi:PPOX class probable F420-dependent enzyme
VLVRSRRCSADSGIVVAVALADEKYMLLTTFRRDGTPVSTPVWVTGLESTKVAFYTSSGSGKAKRLAHTSRVTVQPCDARGRVRPGTEPVEATAELVSGPERDAVYEQVVAKYGFMTKITRFLGAVGGTLRRKRIPYADRAVIVTPDV